MKQGIDLALRVHSPDLMLRQHETDLPSADSIDRLQTHAVAVVVPMSGSTGIYGPSTIASAQLAIAEINARGGVAHRKLEAVFIDSDIGNLSNLTKSLRQLIAENAISGVICLGLSEVRRRVNQIIGGRIPHVYTLPYNGIERAPNVFTIGGTPDQQFIPAYHFFTERRHIKRWAHIGYPWNANITRLVGRCGGKVVFERYPRPGLAGDIVRLAEELASSKPDIVILSLLGQDAVEFDRVFGAMGLGRKILRFSVLTDENALMANGYKNNEGLFISSSYVSTLNSDIHQSFRERYIAMHGEFGPALNTHGQSLYEGLNFYTALVHHRRQRLSGPIRYHSARGGVFHSNWNKEDPMYIAEANGFQFEVIEKLTTR